MEEEDSILAGRAAQGDSAAFTILVRRHEQKVRAFLARLTRDPGVDDLAQEVFVKAWRMAGTWRGEGTYAAWLMQISWTSFLSARRGEMRRRAREQEAFDEVEHSAGDPALNLDAARALARLDERERGAALLCFGEGYSHGEAARIMGLPLGTLKSVLARARLKLIQALEG